MTSHHDPNRDIVGDIAKQAAAFNGTVLLFNGDSHVFRSDNPLVPGARASRSRASGQTATHCPMGDDG